MIGPLEAWALARAVAGFGLNGEAAVLPDPARRMVDHLCGLPDTDRPTAWAAMQAARDDGPEWVKAMAGVDPREAAPGAGTERLTAHLGDLSAANEAGRFTWPRWIVRGHFTLLTSDPKIGKTRVGLELAKRLWHRQPWPDGQAATLPPETKTLWVPGDRQQDELRDLAPAYGLPREAVLLNASPSEPYGGVSMDEKENVQALRERVMAERPGLVFIDTVWRSTRRKLCREDEVNILMDPLIAIAQECDVAIVGMMHASRDGETLGRRLEGLARAVIKLSKPDPGQPARRKLWVDRANFLEPPPLGVTVHDAGCDFDSSPPEDAAHAPSGRPPEKRDAVMAFIRSNLKEQNDRIGNELCEEWIGTGGKKPTFWRGVEGLEAAGELTRDGGPGTRKPTILHLTRPEPDRD